MAGRALEYRRKSERYLVLEIMSDLVDARPAKKWDWKTEQKERSCLERNQKGDQEEREKLWNVPEVVELS